MKYVRNGFVLYIIFSFPLFVYAVQTKNPTSNPNQKPVETSEIVVSVMGGRIRSEPNLQGKILKESTIGSRFTVLEEKNGWSKVELKKAIENEETETGWIANSIITKFNATKPGVLYQQITDKYFKK